MLYIKSPRPIWSNVWPNKKKQTVRIRFAASTHWRYDHEIAYLWADASATVKQIGIYIINIMGVEMDILMLIKNIQVCSQ